ncbi:class I SAM-dependent methyltransferase [Solirubrobacter sp. CPCC 204708]|uniref:Class I SAM-dependent methyltransferase n=1 Tax=Solirubrobacter deserti TaxID=2282478 RepID=A0ABT4RU39_9ACTN|nr:class I SAM-dependent methyltransferase [Solirubrobacter deserti]MBE2314491.1 class I SAM-dependent methyltransferase [Solirubrobacter deserti]MDA0142098.1 class I SAM-dependent methyltransferase [Solirubrobacter deserti]
MGSEKRSVAAAAYDVLAPAYDVLTGGYAYDSWIAALQRLALSHGLDGRRVLDVACGTGHSMLPWLERGYEVVGVDVSERMAAVARAKGLEVHVADMRALPPLGQFNLVTCLGDGLNHLLEPEDVRRALGEMRCALAPGGLAVFDLNLLTAYRDTPDTIVEVEDRVVLWPGAGARIAAPGGVGELVVDVFEREGELWRRTRSRQPHRHHPLVDVLGAARAEGYAIVGVYGQHPGVRLEDTADEHVHAKAIVIARR